MKQLIEFFSEIKNIEPLLIDVDFIKILKDLDNGRK